MIFCVPETHNCYLTSYLPAKRDGTDLHVVFQYFTNAFGSVPHNFLWAFSAHKDYRVAKFHKPCPGLHS